MKNIEVMLIILTVMPHVILTIIVALKIMLQSKKAIVKAIKGFGNT